MRRRCGRSGRFSDAQYLLGGLAAACLAGVPAQGQCQYEISAVIYAPPCPWPFNDPPPTIGLGINELGRVAGYYYHCGGGTGFEAFRWSAGHGMVTLPRPAGVTSAGAWDINDAGVIVGTYTRTDVQFRAFVYESGVFTELAPEPPGLWSQCHAINNAGQAVGYRSIGDGINPYNAFIWSAADGFTDLGVMTGPYSSGSDVNEAGQVVGWTGTGGIVSDAFLWENGTLTLLGPVPGGFTSTPWGISEGGVVVGSGRIPMDGAPVGATKAFRWQSGEFTMLGTLPDHTRSRAHDVTPDGVTIVGESWHVDGDPNIRHAFIWQDGILTDLNELIPSDSNITVTAASTINASGVIVGVAHDAVNNVLTVVLEPVEALIGDIDADCEVGVADLMILLDHFGQTGSPADLNNDGVVNVLDLIILLLNWG